MFERQDDSEDAPLSLCARKRDIASHNSSKLGANAKSKTSAPILLAQT